MARALAARELAQCPIDWSMIERDRQMTSDVKPATDAGLRGVEPADEHEIADALQATAGLHAACITRVCAGGIRALVARIRELEARQVPDGWQVVPKEPTVAMERSATGRDTRDEGIASMYSGIYRAMLAAAPRP